MAGANRFKAAPRNLLHRLELADATTITPIGSAVPYHFIGPAPDSMRVDSDGNLYVAVYGQGRVLVFNKNGIPIGQVLLPGRDEGHNLQSTSMAIKAETNDLYIVTNDGNGGEGATIFHAKVFAHGLPVNEVCLLYRKMSATALDITKNYGTKLAWLKTSSATC